MKTEHIIQALESWAPLVSSGYEAPAAGQVMLEAARALKREIDVDELSAKVIELNSEFDGDVWFMNPSPC